jgi:hypothetical protein
MGNKNGGKADDFTVYLQQWNTLSAPQPALAMPCQLKTPFFTPGSIR